MNNTGKTAPVKPGWRCSAEGDEDVAEQSGADPRAYFQTERAGSQYANVSREEHLDETRIQPERQTGIGVDRRPSNAAALRAARRPRAARPALRLRAGPMRRVHGA